MGGPAPDNATWVVIDYHGDGTRAYGFRGSNIPADPDANGNPTRTANPELFDEPDRGAGPRLAQVLQRHGLSATGVVGDGDEDDRNVDLPR